MNNKRVLFWSFPKDLRYHIARKYLGPCSRYMLSLSLMEKERAKIVLEEETDTWVKFAAAEGILPLLHLGIDSVMDVGDLIGIMITNHQNDLAKTFLCNHFGGIFDSYVHRALESNNLEILSFFLL